MKKIPYTITLRGFDSSLNCYIIDEVVYEGTVSRKSHTVDELYKEGSSNLISLLNFLKPLSQKPNLDFDGDFCDSQVVKILDDALLPK